MVYSSSDIARFTGGPGSSSPLVVATAAMAATNRTTSSDAPPTASMRRVVQRVSVGLGAGPLFDA